METTDQNAIAQMHDTVPEHFQQPMVNVFAGYRAEWLGAELFKLFTTPSYFPQLTTPYPCFLVGGRGTGKTTTLRCLSYQGQAALRPNWTSDSEPEPWPFVGLYYRVNTNRVRAFGGPEISEHKWMRLFGHYVNLELADLVLTFLRWYSQRYPSTPIIGHHVLREFSAAMHLDACTTIDEAIRLLQMSRLRFEAMINNVADGELPLLSMQGAPIDHLMFAVNELPQFAPTSFFFLLDEYENFDSYQQRAVNSLIKHCGELYSFKVGVREFGDSERSTLHEHEKLRHPADYRRIEISSALSGKFSDFAARVCGQRLKSVFGEDHANIRRLFPALAPEEEAIRLGVDELVVPIRSGLLKDADTRPGHRNWIARAGSLEIYTLYLRAQTESIEPLAKVTMAIEDPSKWRGQYDNYKYAYLFSIRRRKPGIRKYYAGWNVYCQLASSNIRFLLELVDRALTSHAETSDQAFDAISPETQTKAARDTGLRNLRELDGLSLYGAKLTRLLLGLGRFFEMMAEHPVGHTPEISQFHLAGDVVVSEHREFVTMLLREGVMYLALRWHQGSKLQDRTDIRQLDYSIHPIFAPVFWFSHRRKRKILLADDDFVSLIDRPKETITRLLRDQRRSLDEDLWEQKGLFSVFYEQRDR